VKTTAFANNSLFAVLSRFTLVGAAATATYLLVANFLMINELTDQPETASIWAYLAGIVVSFVGQSRVTFRLRKTNRGHVARFLTLSLAGLLVSFYSVLGCRYLGVAVWWGTVATAVLVPIVSFVLMKLWVFRMNTK
jgi:putative flippase GtrA